LPHEFVGHSVQQRVAVVQATVQLPICLNDSRDSVWRQKASLTSMALRRFIL